MVCFAVDLSNAQIEIHVIVADYSYCKRQPLERPWGCIEPVCTCGCSTRRRLLKFYLEEELDIAGDDDGDSNEIDDDYVPEGGSRSSGESDGEGGEIQEEGMGTIQRGQVKFIKRGWVKFRERGWVKFRKRGQVPGSKRG